MSVDSMGVSSGALSTQTNLNRTAQKLTLEHEATEKQIQHSARRSSRFLISVSRQYEKKSRQPNVEKANNIVIGRFLSIAVHSNTPSVAPAQRRANYDKHQRTRDENVVNQRGVIDRLHIDPP